MLPDHDVLTCAGPTLSPEDAMALSRLYAVRVLASLCNDVAAAQSWLQEGGAGLTQEQQKVHAVLKGAKLPSVCSTPPVNRLTHCVRTLMALLQMHSCDDAASLACFVVVAAVQLVSVVILCLQLLLDEVAEVNQQNQKVAASGSAKQLLNGKQQLKPTNGSTTRGNLLSSDYCTFMGDISPDNDADTMPAPHSSSSGAGQRQQPAAGASSQHHNQHAVHHSSSAAHAGVSDHVTAAMAEARSWAHASCSWVGDKANTWWSSPIVQVRQQNIVPVPDMHSSIMLTNRTIP